MNPYPAPDNVTHLNRDEVFVFGSNEAGRHGKGAAKTALRWGAILGVGEGLRGKTYAIPTKDKRINTLRLDTIDHYVRKFIKFAHTRKDLTFFVTQIGCGLAGYSVADIAPMFLSVPDNVRLPKAFIAFNDNAQTPVQ